METGNTLFDKGFEKGFEEGKIIGRIELISNMLKSEDDEAIETLEALIRDRIFTEYQKQQALLYIRLGISRQQKRKRRRT